MSGVTYRVEDLKFFNQAIKQKGNMTFDEEKTFSREEKIEFFDLVDNSSLGKLLALINAYHRDVELGVIKMNGSRYTTPTPKTTSIKAWLLRMKKNYGGSFPVNTEYNIGHLSGGLFGTQSLWYGDFGEKFVNDCFHNLLVKLSIKERQYFEAHDEYTVLKNEVVNHPMFNHLTLGIVIGGGTISYGTIDSNRPFTLDELKFLKQNLDAMKTRVDNMNVNINRKFGV